MMVTARWMTRRRFYGYSMRAHTCAMRRRWVFTRASTGVVSIGALDFGATRALDSGVTRALCLGASILGASSVW
ncbi:unnamed protein product [Linum trigynum]|uniref:Uncharacterized protein n=1 Tax=Linum trigynum TaxID=586398 RepID=A0AAV2FZE2_9ROSI